MRGQISRVQYRSLAWGKVRHIWRTWPLQLGFASGSPRRGGHGIHTGRERRPVANKLVSAPA